MESLQSHSAFVLHTRPYKENQALVEMLVEDEGRISMVASKGGKKNSARNALLQPFRAVTIQFKPNSGLKSLKQIDVNKMVESATIQLVGKPLLCGFYLNEIICRLCVSDEYQPELYSLYIQTLRNLSIASNQQLQIELVLRQFEFNLLNLLGYGISFDDDVESGQTLKSDELYELMPETGFVLSLLQRGIWGRDIRNINRLLMSDITLDMLSSLEVERTTLKQAKHILSTCLHRHLGNKPLKSRELFRRS
jgi:DNA repair protein RecO (recombination protein O)